jgi:hypothetical protein
MTATGRKRATRASADAEELSRFAREIRAVMRRRETRVRALAEIDEKRDRLIREAHAAGMTPTELRAQTGLSTQRIDQIRRGARL